MADKLTLKHVQDALTGSSAAFRLTLELEAVAPKVFPPTYEGGKYATEERIINGEAVPCVLLDSVPSQANRMELALQEAWESGLIELPVVSVDFSAVDNPGLPKVTSLQAPHRIADAILRDSLLGKEKFRKSEVGKQLDLLSNGYATPLLQHAPHSLVFGMWDSTGPRGGLGVKFARAVISEIIGVKAYAGVTTASRIDPLNIRLNSGKLYKAEDGGWTLDAEKAEKDPKTKKPILLGKEGKPSEANHGNVTPDIVYRKDKNGNIILGDNERPVMMVVFDNSEEQGRKYVIRDERKPVMKGGFTISYAEQSTVLSLPALRRLRFPTKQGERSNPASDLAARSYLASLGLLGATLAVEAGYDLRSRCMLRAKNAVVWHLLGKPGEKDAEFALDRDAAVKLYKDAKDAAVSAKLPIETKELMLTPTEDLVKLVKKSMELAASETAEGE
ncbi:MAG TPA: type I-U CRISPR-associated RAMP protein Csb1/Cas7u [Gemmatales bacterium]|nr:type I-U CRISPR-associated RAMP protein Csb1/Cas7u [Gemmatales bacterium]